MSSPRQLMAMLDDASWEALASKGLLRRAAKEIARGITCRVVEDSALSLVVAVGDASVRVPPEGPAKARCDCGTPGCCQHIVAAGLFLRGMTRAMTTEFRGDEAEAAGRDVRSAIRDELLGLEWSVVRRWAGAATWRGGLRLHASGVEVVVRDDGEASEVLLRPMDVRCRFLPGTGLDGAIVSNVEPKAARTYVVLAVVGLKLLHGQSLPPEESADLVLREEDGAPRSRSDVLDVAAQLLEMAVATGLARAGRSDAERLATLAVSAEGTNLPRLARALKAASDELALLASRHARADGERALETMAQTYALSAALRRSGPQPPEHLVGQHRTGYVEVAALELVGLTAFPWRTPSGYRGVTVLFREPASAQWLTWTDARSVNTDPRFDPLQVFAQRLPWAGEPQVSAVATSEISLRAARRNAAGRLSSTPTCKATLLRPTQLHTVDFGDRLFRTWTTLAKHLADTNAAGLRPTEPAADWVVLEPAKWGERQFDRVAQRLVWSVVDSAGTELLLVLSYSELTRGGIERLERWEPPAAGVARVLGRVVRTSGEFAVEPLVLFAADGDLPPLHVLIPTGSPAASAPGRAVSSRAEEGDEEEFQDEPGDAPQLPAVPRRLRRAREELVAAVEAGVLASGAEAARSWGALADSLHGSGLPVLAAALAAVAGASQEERPAKLLRAAYVLRLHEQCG